MSVDPGDEKVICVDRRPFREALFARLRKILIFLGIPAVMSAIGMVQAFRFDVRDDIELNFSLCHDGAKDTSDAISKLLEKDGRWDFYVISFDIDCNKYPGQPVTNMEVTLDEKGLKKQLKLRSMPGWFSEFENKKWYIRSGSDFYFVSPSRTVEADFVDYKFHSGFFDDPRGALISGVSGNQGTEVRIRFTKGEGYPYNKKLLLHDVVEDIYSGPFFVSITSDPETTKQIILSPQAYSNDMNKSYSCNKMYGSVPFRRLICSLLIG